MWVTGTPAKSLSRLYKFSLVEEWCKLLPLSILAAGQGKELGSTAQMQGQFLTYSRILSLDTSDIWHCTNKGGCSVTGGYETTKK
jgi:hypothetical protein